MHHRLCVPSCSTFEVTYTYTGSGIKGVTLTTPCSSTHAIDMNQRVVVLVRAMYLLLPSLRAGPAASAMRHAVAFPSPPLLTYRNSVITRAPCPYLRTRPQPYTVNTATNTITVTAPPAAQHGVAARGEYVLWLLGDEVGQFGKTYSQGHWVTLKEA